MTATTSTESLARDLAEAFDGFDARMQKLTANLDPDNVRTAGAMTLEIGMYANSLAMILNGLIGVVARLSDGETEAGAEAASGSESRPERG